VYQIRDVAGGVTIRPRDPVPVTWPVRVGLVPALASAFQPRPGLRERVEAARAASTSAEQLRRYPQVGRDAQCLSKAVGVLLETEDWDQDLTVVALRDMIEAVVPWTALRAAVEHVNQVLPPHVDPDAEWRSALVTRYGQ